MNLEMVIVEADVLLDLPRYVGFYSLVVGNNILVDKPECMAALNGDNKCEAGEICQSRSPDMRNPQHTPRRKNWLVISVIDIARELGIRRNVTIRASALNHYRIRIPG